MDVETQKKLESLSITITIENETFKCKAIEVFHIWQSVTIYNHHIALKNYLKRVMDHLLEKVSK